MPSHYLKCDHLNSHQAGIAYYNILPSILQSAENIVYIPHDVAPFLNHLRKPDIRIAAGVSSENPYLFATTGNSGAHFTTGHYACGLYLVKYVLLLHEK